MAAYGIDYQHNNYNYIINRKSQLPHPRGTQVTSNNVLEIGIYVAVRHCIEATWLNDRDQFLYPNNGWESDMEFQTDCLVYTLFHGQNRISSEHGTNHWIPFTEYEVGAQEKFESHFMSDFLKGVKPTNTAAEPYLFGAATEPNAQNELRFSKEANDVMDAGRNLWRYYHEQPIAKTRPNASFYDIRLYFQGTKTTKSGKVQMCPESSDAHYTELITDLRQKMKLLAKKIEPKVYEYGFLKE